MKKFTAVFLCAAVLLLNTAFAFPTPDWGALLSEKEYMVSQPEFELYAEGGINSASYYGARLEPRAGAYIGMVAESSTDFQPLGSYLTYIEDMWQNDLYYPANSMIKSDSVVTMVGWTINDMNAVDYGTVRSVLDTLNSYNKPMFIRFANEMNVSSLGDDPQKYIEVFRTVADMVHEYPNFAVVWSPNDMGALDRPFEYFYPGDEYVDWIGVSCYSIKYFQGSQNTDYKNSVYFMTGDCAFATNKIKPIIDFMSKNNIQKPVMISEGGVATGNVYGENLESWAAPRLRNMLWYLTMKYPQIKMINYFNTHRANEAEHFDISDYSYACDIFKQAAGSGAYIRSANGSPSFVFSPAEYSGTLRAKNGVVPLYTMAYFRNQPETTVNYYIDGVWYHAASQIPYSCSLSLAGIYDGAHDLTISAANGTAKSYTFYKRGECISFSGEPDMSAAFQGQNISVTVNGKRVEFDQQPLMTDDRTFVPVRAIFEALGAKVGWEEDTQTVIASRGYTNISLAVGSKQLYVNNQAKAIDVPAQLIGSRTFVPVRAIAEAFDCRVEWDEVSSTVIITE